MKRIIIILCLCLAVFTSFGKKVVVIQVNKEGQESVPPKHLNTKEVKPRQPVELT